MHSGLTLAQICGSERYAALLDFAEYPDYGKCYAVALTATGLPEGE